MSEGVGQVRGWGPMGRRRDAVANEAGLRALDEHLDVGDNGVENGNARHEPVANEAGLLALAEHIKVRDSGGENGHGHHEPVANEAGLRSLGEAVKGQPRSVRRPAAGPVPRSFGPAFVADAGLAPTGEVADGTAGPQPARSFDRTDERAPAKRRHAKPRSRRRVWLRRGVVIGVVVVLVIVGGGAGYVYYLTHDLNRIRVQGLQGAFTTGKEAGTENILMVGSTSRCALAVQNPAYGLCSEGVNGVNSDVIMILHVDPNHHRLALVSLPRDLFVPNARKEGPNKIDAGLFEGVSQVVASVEEDFGIPIQHAVTLNFDQFANVVDALGGINMSFPMSVFDAESGLNVQAAVCVHLDGTQALSVVRARHLQYQGAGITTPYANYWPQENLSDLARIRRDHEFLRVLAQAVGKRGLGNPLTDINLINSVKADLNFDQSWPVSDLANLVLDFHSVNINGVPQLTLPVSVVEDPGGAGGGLIYQGSGYGDAEFPAEPQDQATINQVLGIGATTDSMTGNPLPAPATVTVSVVNGSGTADQGAATSASLAALGFHVVGASDAAPVGDVAETVVYYGSRAPAAEAAAEAVARSMSGAVVMAYDPGQVADGAVVTVFTGTDFSVNLPPPVAAPTTTTGRALPGAHISTTTAPAPTTTTTTTTAPSTTSAAGGAIQAPSAPTSALAPWDPRACPSGAVPTAPVANET